MRYKAHETTKEEKMKCKRNRITASQKADFVTALTSYKSAIEGGNAREFIAASIRVSGTCLNRGMRSAVNRVFKSTTFKPQAA